MKLDVLGGAEADSPSVCGGNIQIECLGDTWVAERQKNFPGQ